MSTQSRASVAELTAEFERAMESLAARPSVDNSLLEIAEDLRFLGSIAEVQTEQGVPELSSTLTRIAAIALEGAARLRRQS